MTPRTSLLEHSVPSTIKEVPAELESNCARAAILQFQADRATECYIQLCICYNNISREEYFTEFTVPFSSREGEPTILVI